jgi:hypothetical protein
MSDRVIFQPSENDCLALRKLLGAPSIKKRYPGKLRLTRIQGHFTMHIKLKGKPESLFSDTSDDVELFHHLVNPVATREALATS